MNKIPLSLKNVSRIVGEEKMGLLVLVDKDEKNQLAIPCDEKMLQQVEIRVSYAPERNMMLPEVLWQVISTQTNLHFEILINDLIDEQYRAILYNTETLEPISIRACDAVMLSFIGNIPIYIEERLMRRQSVPYNQGSTRVELPLNALSHKMLKEALDKAVEDENYELATYLRDEMIRRKLK